VRRLGTADAVVIGSGSLLAAPRPTAAYRSN
jgi:hypothetical protein